MNTFSPNQAVVPPSPFTSHQADNGTIYRLTSSAKSWEEAQAEAQNFGGNLVTINDATEEAWLKQTFGANELFWIGLTDKKQENNFQWINGEVSTYRNWAPGEPNDYKFGGSFTEGEDFAVMNWQGQWNDLPNNYFGIYRGIIEIPAFKYQGKTYRLTSSAKSWEEAQAEAQNFGGNLVTINNATEEAWLKQTFGANELFWIGLTDKKQENNFQWINGEVSTYRNWAPGEPNDYKFGGSFTEGEDFAVMNWQGQWNDLPNNYFGIYRGIIEISDHPIPIRINAGGNSYIDELGQFWQADQFFDGGNIYFSPVEIFKTEDDQLYQTERWANQLKYMVPVAYGTYQVKLHFAEIFFKNFNQRKFDISLEGQSVIQDLDIFSKSKNAFFPGENSALIISTPYLRITDGVLNLDMTASLNNAKISAIEIIPTFNPMVIVEDKDGQTIVTEDGTEDTYQVVLNSKPTDNVTINLQTNNQLTFSQSTLTFSPNNWYLPQKITIGAINDSTKEGTQNLTISHTTISNDLNYNNLIIEPLKVKVIDNDLPPIKFTQKTMTTIDKPTTAAWGPDGKLYIGTYDGEIIVYTFDTQYNIIETQSITTLTKLSNNNILGIAFNPFDTSDSPTIYIAHSKLFANGGKGFPNTDLSPYSGQISLLEGADFSILKPLITGLPVSNHDHGINGMTFDNNGDLYIAVGGNTNAGITNNAIGGLPESPLSASVLKATISKPDFNGKIEYKLPDDFLAPDGLTFDPALSQVFGDLAKVKDGVDVSVFAAGLRNPYDLVWTTTGKLYATDNGSNPGFGDESTGSTTQQPAVGALDELNLLIEGHYYGHANRNRGFRDPRQNSYRHGEEGISSDEYTAPLTLFPSSTNGIDEYRATTFDGQLKGNLITQQYDGSVFSINLAANGTDVIKNESLTGIADGLDILTAPGGSLIGIDFTDSRVTVATPDDVVGTAVTAYDIFPWRAPSIGGNRFVIGGQNFGNLENTTVTIGGQSVQITQVTDKQIIGILPSLPTSGKFLDVVVSSGGQITELKQAFLPLNGSANFI
ncbi:malectin domain-containing carbohydrate-binding protein [Alkalinema pantanalense CENA528]|uniref:malectin domain-containing carbohydrate-binding protein n=1 Tax=Alkalinema pantanalense TaxID=1620705 RepID=UPI003D6DE765